MPLDFTPIAQLIPTDEPCKIKVRISRIWGFEKREKPGVITGLDMILVDDKGYRIQASVSHRLLKKFQKELHEGACRVIMNFKLVPNDGSFKGTSHPYKINFLFTTYVKESEDIPNLSNRFYFHPFTEIGSESHDPNVFFDIIGEIVGMSEIQDVTVGGSRTEKLLRIQLRDLGESIIDCSLWSKFAEDVNSYVKSNNNGPIVLLGSLMKTKLFNGNTTVQTNPFASKLYINSDIEEIKEFKEGLCNNDSMVTVSQLTSSNSSQKTQIAFPISLYKTIAQILEEREEKICTTLASIVSIRSDKDWCYIGCTSCFKKVSSYFNPKTEEIERDKYSCHFCKKDITSTCIRYMVYVTAADQTESASFLLFDREVTELIHKSAYELRQQQVEFNRQGEFPQELQDLEGSLVLLKVKVTSSSSTYKNSSLQVTKVSVDPSEIQKFKDVADIKESTPAEISILESTPAEIALSTTTSIANSIQVENTSSESDAHELLNPPFTPNRKRALAAVVDLEAAQESSTKANTPKSVNKPKGSSKVTIKKEKKS